MKKAFVVNLLTASTIVTVLISSLLFMRFEGKITGFFWIGDVLPFSPYLNQESALINKGSTGYDGQMFLTIALDPTLRNAGTRAALDNPPYRYRRIGYPLLGFFLGLGRPAAIPYALVMINVLGTIAIVLLGTLFINFTTPDEPRWWLPICLLATPGLWVTLYLSTADLLASVFLIAGLLGLRMDKSSLAALFLGGACFVRETYLASLIMLCAFQYSRNRISSALQLLLAAIPPLLWVVWVHLTMDAGTVGTQGNIGIPFVGILEILRNITTAGLSPSNAFEAYCLLLLLFTAGIVTAEMLVTWRNPALENVALMPYVALLILSAPLILEYHAGYLRVFICLSLIPILTLATGRFTRAKMLLLGLNAISSTAYVINMLVS